MQIQKYELALEPVGYVCETNNLYGEGIRVPEDVIVAAKRFNLNRRPCETLAVFALNTKNEIIGYFEASRGTVNTTICDPAEVFKFLCACNAARFILAHNHPSGDPTPSSDDISTTERMRQAGMIMNIPLIDHVVVTSSGAYTSIIENCI